MEEKKKNKTNRRQKFMRKRNNGNERGRTSKSEN